MRYTIENIRRGLGERCTIIYAEVWRTDIEGNKELCICATLEHCVTRIAELI